MKHSCEYSKTYFMLMANGHCWQLTAADPAVCEFVERYAAVCSMTTLPALPSVSQGTDLTCRVDSFDHLDTFRKSHPELIETGRKQYFRIFFSPYFENSFVFFNMPEFQTETMRTLGVNNINVAMQLQMVGRGNCAPCHCALLQMNGNGALIGGSGDSGKTTCARRIPKPYSALADDYALLFEHQGKLLAQAMPTWSNLINGNRDYRADCSCSTMVDAFFFLRQSPDDDVQPINGSEAVTYMNSVIQDLLAVRTLVDMPEEMKKGIRRQIFKFADRLCRWKPTYLLYASLYGKFWEHMEKALRGECA